MKKHIPNILTLSNLFCGCIAVYFISGKHFSIASVFVFVGAIFDFLDGFVARKLKVSGQLGLQLDSLADMVTFGVVPGFVMFQMIGVTLPQYAVFDGKNTIIAISSIGFLITIFSAYRLARFNIDATQTDQFIGLPTPANTLLIMSLPLILIYQDNRIYSLLLKNPFFLIAICGVSSFLMNTRLPLLSLKIKSFSIVQNKYQYLLVLIAFFLLLTLGFVGVVFTIMAYMFLSFFKNRLG